MGSRPREHLRSQALTKLERTGEKFPPVDYDIRGAVLIQVPAAMQHPLLAQFQRRQYG